MTTNRVFLLALGVVGAFMGGALTLEHVLMKRTVVIAEDVDALRVILDECNYSPHPISDVSWELYRQRLVPRGTPGYYTMMVKSVNGDAAECLKERLPEWWTAPGGP